MLNTNKLIKIAVLCAGLFVISCMIGKTAVCSQRIISQHLGHHNVILKWNGRVFHNVDELHQAMRGNDIPV